MSQFTTREQADQIRAIVDATGIGGGVDSIDPGDPKETHWSEPDIGEFNRTFRFRNGAAGFNVGLIANMIQRYPPHVWQAMLKAEVDPPSKPLP